MGPLTDLLFLISNALLIPVIGALVVLFAYMIFQLGGLLSEALVRYRHRPKFSAAVRDLKLREEKAVALERVQAKFGLPEKACQQLNAGTSSPDKVLDDLQLDSESVLSRLTLVVRLAPVLGLAGTLIPLGPALLALSGGDFAELSSKLVVAFTTTVIGLVTGGGCYTMYSIRRMWYMRDLNDLEFIMKRHNQDANDTQAGRGSVRPTSGSCQPV